MLKDLFACTKAKIVLIVSWILALAMIIAGAAVSFSEDEGGYDGNGGGYSSSYGNNDDNQKLYTGTVVTISENTTEYFFAEEKMYKFTPASDKYYTITVSSDFSCSLYVLTKNSQTQMDEEGYHNSKRYFYSGSLNTYLSEKQTYYIYIVAYYSGNSLSGSIRIS